MKHRLLLLSLLFINSVHDVVAAGEQLWTIPFALVASPAVRGDGSIVAQSADTLILVSPNGAVQWRMDVRAATSEQPPMIDDQGNVVILASDGVRSYAPNGTLRWSYPLAFSSMTYGSLALGRRGEVLIKSGFDWHALDSSGQRLWTSASPPVSGAIVVDPGVRSYSPSPAIVAPDGNLRYVDGSDTAAVLSAADGRILTTDIGNSAQLNRGSMLLCLGPSGEAVVLASRQSRSAPVEGLPTPSAGNYRIRWTSAAGTGESWSNAFVLGNGQTMPVNQERVLHGLCAPSGEVLVATARGTVIMPHNGIGSRRWPETSFAIAADGDVLCFDGTQLVLRHADQSIGWSAAAEGSHFTLAPNGRVYGGGQSLSAYDVGVAPASGPWAQPRGDALQRARAPISFGPFTPSVTSRIEAPAAVELFDSYAGQVPASPYVQGPGTLTWERSGVDIGIAADDYSFVLPLVSTSSAAQYQLRIDTSRGPVRSGPITVTVRPPAPVRPGLYWGTLRPPNNSPYLLEIGTDRSIQYLSADGSRLTTAMRARLDPAGGYPWTNGIAQYSNITLGASADGVTVAWQGGTALPAIPAATVLPSGARVGWYIGNIVGVLTDECIADTALLPDGTLIGSLAGPNLSLAAPTVALSPAALTQSVQTNLRYFTGSPTTGWLTATFDTSGSAKFRLVASGQSQEFETFTRNATPETRLMNLATRSRVGANAGLLTIGFVVATPGNFLVRGVGPTLARYAVPAPLETVVLRLMFPNGDLVAENRGWSALGPPGIAALSEAANRCGAFQLQTGSMDAALLTTLNAGPYTAMISSAGEGDALAEVYAIPAVGTQPAPRLVNLSTRGQLTAENPTVTVGFVYVSDVARPILIRGVGPGLKPFVGDAQVCTNPRIRVFDSTGKLFSGNNDWGSAWQGPGLSSRQGKPVQEAAAKSGAFPLPYGSQDAAVVLNLPGGAYTVQLDAETASIGQVLFEVYAVP